MGNVVVVGSSNTDMVLKVGTMPRPGETVLGGTFFMAAGGKGANQAVAAARAGGRVCFVACVGEDLFGEASVRGFQEDGIQTDYVFRNAVEASGVALIFVDGKGENCIGVASGANAALTPDHIEQARPAIAAADVLVMQLETPIDTVATAARMAYELGKTVILNPAPAQVLDDSVLGCVHILTPNETEAGLLTGVDTGDMAGIQRAAGMLLDRGIKNVLITLGSQGILVATPEYREVVPAFQVTAVDTTAAGDVFNGALAVALSEGIPLLKAVRFAAAAAAISVTRNGAQPSAPKREEIERLMATVPG